MNSTGFSENKKREWLTPTVAYLIAASMFFLRQINFFNMVFYYLGLDSIKTVLSTGLYCLLDLYLGLYFLKVLRNHFNGFAVAAMAVVGVLGGVPYLLQGRFEGLLQYVIFVIPFLLICYLCIFDEDGLPRFFRSLDQFSWFAAVMAVVYVVLLFAVADEATGAITIVGMHYGDIAYALTPFYIYTMMLTLHRTTWKELLRLVIFFVAICYTGTRSALIIMFFSIIVYVVLFLLVRGFHRNLLLKGVALVLGGVVLFTLCSKIVPSSSRLTVAQDGIYEIHEQEAANADDTNKVFNVDTQEYQTVNLVYIHYLVESDLPRLETEKLLHDDIVHQTGKYIVVTDSQAEELSTFTLHMNRIVLWSSAFQEFLKAPIFGNGSLYYQAKYNYFPHNIILELLCDYGVVGTLLFVLLVCWITIRALVYVHKRYRAQAKQDVIGYLSAIVLGLSFAPMHLLYTGFYSNTMLVFLVMILIFMNIRFSKWAACKSFLAKK